MLKYFLKNFAVILLSLLLASNAQAGIDFDVIDDSISCGTADIFTENGAVTISAWIYPETAGEGGFGRIVDRSVLTTGPIFFLRDDGATLLRRIMFRIDGATDLVVASNNNFITYNTWQHVLVTWDGSITAANVHIYIDNSEVTYATQTNGLTFVDNSGQTFRIGAAVSGGSVFDGQITEVAIWNVVLSTGEITQLANSRIKGMPLQIQPSALKGYWPLDDEEAGTSGDGDSFLDLSGNGNTGTGSDGADNLGLAATGETVLSYPSKIIQ